MLDFLNDAIFPTFRKFTSEDYLDYQAIYIKSFAPYGDISPANLLVWLNIDGTLSISRLDNAIILRYSNPFENNEQNFIILEEIVTEQHIRDIYALGQQNNYPVRMREQPAPLSLALSTREGIIIEPNRDSYEYILDVHQHATLPGKPFSRQRRRMGFFEREHEMDEIEVRYIDSVSEDDKITMINLIAKWRLVANDETIGEDNREFEALTFAIQSLDALERPAMFIYINNEPISFSIFSIYGDTAIVGHIKIDYTFQYAFDYSTHKLAKELEKRNVLFMNFEQDLGIPGLREHKLRLRPVRMLEKVDITIES